MTIRQIRDRLFKMGVRPKRSVNGNWGGSSISPTLSSEIYSGKYYYNRRKVKEIKGQKSRFGNPKKTTQYEKKSDWILVKIEPIISEELYEQASTAYQKVHSFGKCTF